MNKKVKIISSLLLGVVTLGGIVSYKIMAQENEASPSNIDIKDHAAIKCYATGSMISADKLKSVEELEAEKVQLKLFLKQKKINKETYVLRMKKLKKEIKSTKDFEKQMNKIFEGGYDE